MHDASQTAHANVDEAQALLASARICLEERRYAQALELARLALNHDAQCGAAMHLVGLAYLRLQEGTSALKWLEIAVASSPQDALIQWQLGLALEKNARRELAIKHFNAAQALTVQGAREGRPSYRLQDLIKETILCLGVHVKGRGAVLLSSSGLELDWLIDLRKVFMHRPTLMLMAADFWARFKGHTNFQLACLESASIPLMTCIMLTAPAGRHLNGFIVRKERKPHGLGNVVEGDILDMPIVLIDDILNSGKSLEKARLVAEKASVEVLSAYVVVDYSSGAGVAWRNAHRVNVASMFGLGDFALVRNETTIDTAAKYRCIWRAGIQGGDPFHIVPKSAPLYCDGHVYKGADIGKMQAFDAETGALTWEYAVTGATPRKGIWSTPVVDGVRLYFGAYNGVVYCLDRRTGQEIWTNSLGDWVGASPLVVAKHNLLYIGVEMARPWSKGSMVALDMDSGEKVWEVFTKNYQHGSAGYCRKHDLLIWPSADHVTLGMSPRTGEVMWSFATQRSVKGSVAVDEARGLAAFASFDKSIYVIDAATGALLLKHATDEICYTTPLFVDGRLFCGSGDKHLYVFDVKERRLIKKIPMHARVYGAPCLVDGVVMVGANNGRLMAIDPQTLAASPVLQMPDAVTNAVAHDGARIFVATCMNDLYAFERVA
jgi:outer membrane protein assembly factor BamB